MKSLNKKGFTLIELLAVIVIMGILMFVAIPAVSRTIENSRKDTFKDTAKQYVNQVKTLWASDGLMCNHAGGTDRVSSTSLSSGTYYVEVDSTDPWLLEQGGKSSWGNKPVTGHVRIVVTQNIEGDDTDSDGTPDTNLKTIVTTEYGIQLSDNAGHGINMTLYDNLVRGDVQAVNVSDFSFDTSPSDIYECFEA